jgi:hypothetical protein
VDGGELSYRDERSSTLEPARTRLAQGLRLPAPRVAAFLVALAAFICYRATLLPGLDFGDSASFQTGVGSLTLTPRQAYPLYYAFGNIFVWLDPNGPAHAMNLASAVYGAIAVGLATALAAELAGSTLGGVTAGLFLAFSYTFWTQAITAEVYTLHLLIMGAATLVLLLWSRQPTLPRLALFYAIYALGFGNHLSMILLLPAFAVFILISRDGKEIDFDPFFDPIRPKAIALAAAIAGLAALQYSWNFRGLWADPEPPTTLVGAVGKFWFDVTKADWRETLVMGLSEAGLRGRPAMYWFDLKQQFGVPGVVLAGLGIAYVTARSPRRGILLILLYAANLAFAWTYNVGDAYVFFLPSHYVVALCAGAAAAALMWLASRLSNRAVATTIGGLCLIYPAWRGYDTFPAVDRSWDQRAIEVLDSLTSPPYSSHKMFCEDAILGLDANWQVQNAVAYYMREWKPGIGWFTSDDLLWLTPDNPGGYSRFVQDNFPERPVVITAEFLRKLRAIDPAERLPLPERPEDRWLEKLAALPSGTPYVVGILRPDHEYPIDRFELNTIWGHLTGRRDALPALETYNLAIGRIGDAPQVMRSSRRPFRLDAQVGPLQFDVRMESWLPTDTIRRSGFGHVIVNRRHALTLERGISLLATSDEGLPLLTEYRAGLFAPIPRFVSGHRDDLPAPCYR